MVSTLLHSYAEHRLPHLVRGECCPLFTPGNSPRFYTELCRLLTAVTQLPLTEIKRLLQTIKHAPQYNLPTHTMTDKNVLLLNPTMA